jgi:hypothetical protein
MGWECAMESSLIQDSIPAVTGRFLLEIGVHAGKFVTIKILQSVQSRIILENGWSIQKSIILNVQLI